MSFDRVAPWGGGGGGGKSNIEAVGGAEIGTAGGGLFGPGGTIWGHNINFKIFYKYFLTFYKSSLINL